MKNERSTKRKSAKSTNATNLEEKFNAGLEEKFNAGENVLDYFDASQATRSNQRGGARRGAGRKTQQHVRLQVYVSASVREKAQKLAKSGNTTLSAVVEKALLRPAD